MSHDKDNLTNHDYDGIREYDNPLPNWWLATFIGSVIFAFIYWLHYEFGGGPTLLAEFKEDMGKIQSQRPAEVFDSEEELLKLSAQANIISSGKGIYLSKCASCHGIELQGIIGPNLVDEYWLHGGKISDMTNTIRKGVLEKGMPAFETMIKADEIKSVAVYINSNRGSKPANSKAPQGEKFDPNRGLNNHPEHAR